MNDSQKLAAVLEMLEARSKEADARVDNVEKQHRDRMEEARVRARANEVWRLVKEVRAIVNAD